MNAIATGLAALLGSLFALWPQFALADPFDDHMKLMVKYIDKEDEAKVKQLLKTPYVDINDTIVGTRTYSDGYSYLGHAVHNCKSKIVKVLLDAGAAVEGNGTTGRTPLYEATASGCVDAVAELLKAKANPNAIGTKGYIVGTSVLQIATLRCYLPNTTPIIRLLRQYGADLNSVGSYRGGALWKGYSSLHLVIMGVGQSAVPEACSDAARALVDSTLPGVPDFSLKESTGLIPVNLAAVNCDKYPTSASPQRAKVRQEIITTYVAAGSPPVAVPAAAKCPYPY